MVKLLPFILILMLGTAYAEIQVDKVAHFGAGYIITDVSYELLGKNDDAKLFGFVATLITATAKEGIDGHFDLQDWTATMAGSVFCISIKF